MSKAGERRRLVTASHKEALAEVSVMHIDADTLLRKTRGRWDVVIVDFPDPSTPDLAKLFSLEFYLQLRRHLADDAVVALQSGSPYANRSAFWSVRDTLEQAGFTVASLHAHVPTFGEWGWHLARFGHPVGPVGAMPAGARFVTPEVVAAATVFGAPFARPAGPPRISTRLDPVVMNLYRRGEGLSGPTLFGGRAQRER